MEKIKAVIWDMGGVILRTNGGESRQELANDYNISLDSLYNLVFNSPSAEKATLGLITEIDHWNSTADSLGFPRHQIQELQDRFWAGDQIDKPLLDFIKGLNKNFKTGLLSNAWSGARQFLNQHNACDMVFKYSMFSCEVRLRKPDAKIYRKILEMMEVEAQAAIFVDDLLENIVGAEAVGIKGIQFKSTDQAIGDINRLISNQT